tara:strand:+ start:603 stop:950 length:348 start_codon:yes stop_codon:yes gene_type:complete
MINNFNIKIKENIIQEFKQDLYRNLNMDLYDADHFFGYYNGYIYKLINRVYDKHGAKGLRIEIKYIIEYLIFLFNKIKNNSKFEDYILVIVYFRLYYKHYSYRNRFCENQLSFNF